MSSSAYRNAFDRIPELLGRRARGFRNQVITVALGGLACAAWTLAVPSLSAASFLLVLLPICGLFVYRDNRLVDAWRSELVSTWATREIDLAAYRAAVRANPALPTATVDGMLMTLPSAGDLVAEQRVCAPTRSAVAAASDAIHRGRTDSMLLRALASAIAVSAILPALALRAWTPLLGLATLAAWPALGAWLRRRRRVACEAVVAACRRLPGFDEAEFERLLDGVR